MGFARSRYLKGGMRGGGRRGVEGVLTLGRAWGPRENLGESECRWRRRVKPCGGSVAMDLGGHGCAW